MNLKKLTIITICLYSLQNYPRNFYIQTPEKDSVHMSINETATVKDVFTRCRQSGYCSRITRLVAILDGECIKEGTKEEDRSLELITKTNSSNKVILAYQDEKSLLCYIEGFLTSVTLYLLSRLK